IYMLGDQPGNSIFENYVYDEAKSAGAGSYGLGGVYLDQGSSDMTLQNNVTENLTDPYHGYAVDLILNGDNWRNTIINFTGQKVDNNSSSANTFINNGSINPTAIKANAGIESAYADITSASYGTVVGPPDTQAPSVPTNLSASAVSSSQINLTWNASSDNVG